MQARASAVLEVVDAVGAAPTDLGNEPGRGLIGSDLDLRTPARAPDDIARVERDRPLRRCHRGTPPLGRFGSEGAQRAEGNEMALQIEGVVDGGMN